MPARRPSASSITVASHGHSSGGKSPSAWWLVAGIALIVAAIAVAYWPAIRGGFILDDEMLLTDNELIQSPSGLYWFWCTTQPTDYWPLTNTSFWIEWRLWGKNPTGYHVTNLLLHVVAVLLIWAILRKLAIPGAFLAALLFAVHPVNVESVAWISQRKNTLAIVFFLLSILWYLRAEEGRGARGERREEPKQQNYRGLGLWYWLSLGAFLLAMLSKGSVAILPVVLLLIVWWQRRRIGMPDVLRTIPFFVVAFVLTGVDIWFQKHGLDLVVRNVDFAQRLTGAGAVVWFYLSKALAPIDLVFVYPQWQIESQQLLWWLPLIAAVSVTLLLLWRQWQKRTALPQASGWSRAMLFSWLFFCVALVPVLGFTDVGFMQYSLVADHYQHIALIAVAALVAAAWNVWLWRSPQTMRWAAIGTAVGIFGMLTFLAHQQSALYAGPLTLYQATLKQNPGSWLIHNDVGVALHKTGDLQQAVSEFNQALRLQPDFADTHYNYGNVLFHLGQTQQAIQEYEQALRLKPTNAEAEDNLGSALAQAGRFQEAIEHFKQSLRLKPNSAITHNNLGNVLGSLDQPQQSIEQYREALRLKPEYAEAHNNLGVALFESNPKEALIQFQLALQANPNYPDAHNNLGNTLFRDGQLQEAVEQYELAVRLKPSYTEVYANLAKVYAQLQQHDRAIATAEKGLELARSQGRASLVEQIESWLKENRSQRNPSKDAAPQQKGAGPSP